MCTIKGSDGDNAFLPFGSRIVSRICISVWAWVMDSDASSYVAPVLFTRVSSSSRAQLYILAAFYADAL